jgi:hypothetical protein
MDIDPVGGSPVASGSRSRILRVPEAVYKDRVLPVNDYRPAHAGSSCPLIIDNGATGQTRLVRCDCSLIVAAGPAPPRQLAAPGRMGRRGRPPPHRRPGRRALPRPQDKPDAPARRRRHRGRCDKPIEREASVRGRRAHQLREHGAAQSSATSRRLRAR